MKTQADSLRAIKLKNQSFAGLQAPDENSFYLPYASSYTYDLSQSSHYQNHAYYGHLYSPSKETLKNVVFHLVGTGLLTYFGDQTNRYYKSPKKTGALHYINSLDHTETDLLFQMQHFY